jgi:hypothetical protein
MTAILAETKLWVLRCARLAADCSSTALCLITVVMVSVCTTVVLKQSFGIASSKNKVKSIEEEP